MTVDDTEDSPTRGGISPVEPQDAMMQDSVIHNPRIFKTNKSHELASRIIKTPAFSYAWLELISDPRNETSLDNLTVRSYLTAAFSQFLGLTGSSISVDILKVEDRECWIRVPREDLSAVLAALGGWVGRGENSSEVGWRIRGSGNWLGTIVGRRSVEKLWTG
jgi:ribonuclease P/MRP protein subunit POP8